MNNEQLEDWLCELHNILGEPNEQHKQKVDYKLMEH
jgi:hypothetical protein